MIMQCNSQNFMPTANPMMMIAAVGALVEIIFLFKLKLQLFSWDHHKYYQSSLDMLCFFIVFYAALEQGPLIVAVIVFFCFVELVHHHIS